MNSEGKSDEKPLNNKRKRHLIVIMVFAVIGLIGGLTSGAGGIGLAVVAIFCAIIGAIFGISIIPWLAYVKEEFGIQLKINQDYDFSLMTVLTFVSFMLLKMIWASIRSPFVGIYQLVTGNYD